MSPTGDSQEIVLLLAASAANELEATLICSRLEEAGIHSVQAESGRAIVPGMGAVEGASAPRDVYVERHNLQRAHDLLAAARVSDAELLAAEQDDAAGRQAHQQPQR